MNCNKITENNDYSYDFYNYQQEDNMKFETILCKSNIKGNTCSLTLRNIDGKSG